MRQIDRRKFDHVGIPSPERHAGERWVEATRVWVTSPREHHFNVEWLRFEADSPVTGLLRTQPHVAYRVENVNEAIEGRKVLLAPFEVGNGFAKVAFVEEDGALIELMEYENPNEEGWF